MNMYQLERDLIAALEDENLDILMDSYPEGRISEIADSHVPVYYSELAQCLADDISLAELERWTIASLIPSCGVTRLIAAPARRDTPRSDRSRRQRAARR